MPLVRIDVRKGKDAAYRQKIGRIVYDALVSVGVPEKDRFQIIAEHEADGCWTPARGRLDQPHRGQEGELVLRQWYRYVRGLKAETSDASNRLSAR